MKLYSDTSWLPPGREGAHVTALAPFWGAPSREGVAGWADYADRLVGEGRSILDLVPIEDCDLAVHPLIGRLLLRTNDGEERARAFADFARSRGKPSAFFFDHADTRGHTHPPFPVEDAYVFRGSLFRSRRNPRHFALPGFHDDLVQAIGGTLPLRPKGQPVVSFCGAVIPEHPGPRKVSERARRVAGDTRRLVWQLQGRHEEDLYARARSIEALRRQTDVATSIIVRETGGGGTWERFDAELWRTVRREYIQNMVDSDYVLCVRGDGNWSIRLYESLSLGRIPVIVDTDLVMPYDFLLAWRDYGVWLERGEISEIGAKIASFHDGLTAAGFEERQRACRRLWEDYLSPLGFFRNFNRHFERRPS